MNEEDPLAVLHEMRSRLTTRFKVAKDEMAAATKAMDKASKEMDKLAVSIGEYDKAIKYAETDVEIVKLLETA